MDFAEALTAEEFWGWPVEVLEHLWTLRQQAHQGTITLEVWRERDAAARIGLSAIDTAEVERFQGSLLLDAPPEMPRDERRRIVRLLTALTSPAPDDEKLWKDLEDIEQDLKGPHRDRRSEEMYRSERERIIGWLTRPGADFDAVTGLPWSQIARYRTVHNPDLGQVPQYVDIARNLATDNASPEDLQRAALVCKNPTQQAVNASFAEIYQGRLTWLPDLLLDAASDAGDLQPLLTDQLRTWSDPRVQRLLMQETASGWPPLYKDLNDQESSEKSESPFSSDI